MAHPEQKVQGILQLMSFYRLKMRPGEDYRVSTCVYPNQTRHGEGNAHPTNSESESNSSLKVIACGVE